MPSPTDATFDFEVFAPGTYHHHPAFTEESLDEMARNFETLSALGLKVPLKVGHSTAQLLAGQTDGDPALGVCTRLRRVGDKLVATFANIPQAFAELIRKGRYLKGSSEVALAFEASQDEANIRSGVKGKVLTAFAVVGADLPKIKNLADLASFLGCETPLAFSDVPTDSDAVACIETALALSVTPDDVATLVRDAVRAELVSLSGSHALPILASKEPPMSDATDKPTPDPALTAKFADLEAKLTAQAAALVAKDQAMADALAKRDAEIAKLSEDGAKAREREAAADTRARHADAVTWVGQFSEAGNLRILPAQRAIATVLRERLTASDATIAASELTACFSDPETPRDLTLGDCFERFVRSLPDHKVLLTEVTKHTDATIDQVGQFIATKAKELGKNPKDPVVIREMTLLCASERPELLAAQAS